MSSSYHDYDIEVWQQIQPWNQPPSHKTSSLWDGFRIDFYITKVARVKNYDSNSNTPPSTVYEQTSSKRESGWLLKDEGMCTDNNGVMSTMLSVMLKLPEEKHGDLLREIATVARSAGASRMPIVVNIKKEYTIVLDTTEIYDEVKPIPASKSSIEALEKVSSNADGECIICMQEFQIGSEVTRMPCSHVYHGDCVVKWLKTSHFCPLCRYPMPQ